MDKSADKSKITKEEFIKVLKKVSRKTKAKPSTLKRKSIKRKKTSEE